MQDEMVITNELLREKGMPERLRMAFKIFFSSSGSPTMTVFLETLRDNLKHENGNEWAWRFMEEFFPACYEMTNMNGDVSDLCQRMLDNLDKLKVDAPKEVFVESVKGYKDRGIHVRQDDKYENGVNIFWDIDNAEEVFDKSQLPALRDAIDGFIEEGE